MKSTVGGREAHQSLAAPYLFGITSNARTTYDHVLRKSCIQITFPRSKVCCILIKTTEL
jgi:hypothetical protein